MTLLASRLDAKIERGAVRRVVHPSRVKVYSVDGKLTQNFPSDRMKHYYDVSHGVRSQADYMTVLGAFYAVMGNGYAGLLFRDEADHEASRTVAAKLSSCTLVTGSTYQLNRVYAFGAYSYVRAITRPLNNGALVVYDAGGTPLTPTISYTTGTFTVASGTPATWAGEFLVPVAFSSNEWSATLEVHTQNLHLVNGQIELEEVFE
jgi:uncharacterized protein (TIGR02217 family)